MIVTVTPTIMDGTVVRWYAGEDAEDRGEELASASRNRAIVADGAPDSLRCTAESVHAELRRNRNADLSYLATHRRERLFGPLVPLLSSGGGRE